MGRFVTLVSKLLVSSQTFSSSGLYVVGSDFTHIFSAPNAKITCHNIDMVHSSSGPTNYTAAQIVVVGEIPEEPSAAYLAGNYRRTCDAIAYFENLSLGDTKTIKLHVIASGPTGTISNLSALIFVIEEFD